MNNDWYCRYCSHYTTANRCICNDAPTPLLKKAQKHLLKMELTDLQIQKQDINEQIKEVKYKLKKLDAKK